MGNVTKSALRQTLKGSKRRVAKGEFTVWARPPAREKGGKHVESNPARTMGESNTALKPSRGPGLIQGGKKKRGGLLKSIMAATEAEFSGERETDIEGYTGKKKKKKNQKTGKNLSPG